MNTQTKKQLKVLFPSTRFNEPLAAHCTFRIGGPADAYIETADPKPLIAHLKTTKTPFLVIGGGSNILFHDKGFRGVVIRLTPRINSLTFTRTSLAADAGTLLQTLIKKAAQKGFYNLTALTGIPGTLGGAIRGNAGANGAEIKDFLISALIFNPKTGRTRTATTNSLRLSYRNSLLKHTNEIVLRATLKLSKAARYKHYKMLAKTLAAKRTKTQPYGLSAGSFFKNPDSSPTPSRARRRRRRREHQRASYTNSNPSIPSLKAGFLIDQCGLKGKRIGGAQISTKHANFIENIGVQGASGRSRPATQKDVLRLAALAKKAVRKRFKIILKEEVQIVPEKLK